MFGLDFNTLADPDCEFRKIGKLMLAPNLKIPSLQLLRFFAPKLLEILKISENPPQMLPFFVKLLQQSKFIRSKESIPRNDMMQLMLDLLEQKQIADVSVSSDSKEKFGYLSIVVGSEGEQKLKSPPPPSPDPEN